MNAQDIADFLQNNPDFFVEYPGLLADITVPHPTNGQAISLTERQVATLRDKLTQVQGKLAELVGFGEENDAISEKVHQLSLGLIAADSFETICQTVYTHLIEHFAVPHVRLRIWSAAVSDESPAEHIEASDAVRGLANELPRPLCGPARGHDEVLAWFGDAGEQLGSWSLIPLRRGTQSFGLLALGSEDPQRFFIEMGTLYVERIGELVSAALSRQD